MTKKTALTVAGLFLLLLGMTFVGLIGYNQVSPLDIAPGTYDIIIASVNGGNTNPPPGHYVGDGVLTITAIPNSGYVFSYWELNDAYLSSNPTINVDLGPWDLIPVFITQSPTPTPNPSTHPTQNPFPTPTPTSISPIKFLIPNDLMEQALMVVMGIVFAIGGVFLLWLRGFYKK